MRLPDALGQPQTTRLHLKVFLQIACKHINLADGIPFGNGGQDRFIEATCHQFDLAGVNH